MSNIHDNPEGFSCAACNVPFAKRMTMGKERDGKVKKGMIMICSACGTVNVLGDTSLHPMTKTEFNALPEITKRTIAIAHKEVVKHRGEWTPYANGNKK